MSWHSACIDSDMAIKPLTIGVNNMNTAIKEFLEANAIKRRAIIRCGFELETQKTEGDETETDYDAADEEISNEVSSALAINFNLRWIENHLSESTIDTIRDNIRENIELSFDYSDYQMSTHESIADKIDNENIEVGEDGSVSGVEIRTIGGLKYIDFVSALKDTFKLNHKIDEKCSFHIHLSIPGVNHSYGERFQLALVEYLVESIPRLPKSVQKRFKSAPQNQYIKGLTSSRNKYSFVNAHSLNTWEFRCFGNVQNESEGITCLNIAIEAMAYAYEVTKLGKPLMTDTYEGDITELLNECLSYLMPVSKRLRQMRLINNKRHSA